MAGSKEIKPVMHCTEKNFRGLFDLSKKILTKGIYLEIGTFASPTVIKADFSAAFDKFSSYIPTAKTNSDDKKLRDMYGHILFGYLKSLLEYAKPICNGDIDTIILSGFDSNRQPEKHSAPEQPVIEKVVPGKNDGTYKVFVQLKRNKTGVNPNPVTHDKSVKYCVEITTTPDIDDSWTIVNPSASILNLTFTKYTPLVKNYVRVYGINASGAGQKSVPYVFLPM